MTMQIDSGSEANCLRVKDFLKIDNRPPLEKTRVVLKAYNGEGVIPEGQVVLDVYTAWRSKNENEVFSG